MSFNQLTPAEDERLTVLAEECAEVIVAIAKIQRHGYRSHDPTVAVPEDMNPETNRQALTREMGDVRAAMIMLCNAGDVSKSSVHEAADQKLKSIRRWLHHQP